MEHALTELWILTVYPAIGTFFWKSLILVDPDLHEFLDLGIVAVSIYFITECIKIMHSSDTPVHLRKGTKARFFTGAFVALMACPMNSLILNFSKMDSKSLKDSNDWNPLTSHLSLYTCMVLTLTGIRLTLQAIQITVHRCWD